MKDFEEKLKEMKKYTNNLNNIINQLIFKANEEKRNNNSQEETENPLADFDFNQEDD